MKKTDKENGALIDSPLVRFGLLLGAALFGLFAGERIFWTISCMVDVSEEVEKYLESLCVSIFVFLALWWLRTRDSRQQIAASNAQIQQTNFISGMDKLVQDAPIQIEVGITLLLEVSKKTDAFDTEIRLAFIKRLKTPTSETQAELEKAYESFYAENENAEEYVYTKAMLTYAQYILKWLIDHQSTESRKPNLDWMNCAFQEFTIDGLDLRKILYTEKEVADGTEPHYDWVSFYGANHQENLDFTDISSERIYFGGPPELPVLI